jgi:excisionase family DNA binding protein
MASDYYTVKEAGRVLHLTEGRIRQLLISGELEGERDPVNDRWRIPQAAVHARKEERAPLEVARRTADAREWIEKVEVLRQELGRVEGRLELTAQAESTLREALEHERESLERERERADRLEERTEELRVELEAERSKGFWARLFGGN